MAITTCIFDAYGTLFDVTSAARRAAAEPEFARIQELWPQIAQDWRLKQLQYTWLRAITGDHTDFWAVTGDGLDWALERAGFVQDGPLCARLMQLYTELTAYPEVPAMLAALKSKGLATGILSNGAPQMLASAVGSAGLGDLLDQVLSVESVGVYKPSAKVYDMVGAAYGCARDQVLFVSSNGWDAAGATGYGFTTAWVNRAGEPVDRMDHRPAHTLADLTPIPALVGAI